MPEWYKIYFKTNARAFQIQQTVRRAKEIVMHYDVVEHSVLSPDFGTEDDVRQFALALREQDLGLLMDVVPNHMGIDDPNNRLWQDVLENGPASPYASFVEIDWDPP